MVDKFQKMKRDLDRVHNEMVKRKRLMILANKNKHVPKAVQPLNNFNKNCILGNTTLSGENELFYKIRQKLESDTVKSYMNQSARYTYINNFLLTYFFIKKY